MTTKTSCDPFAAGMLRFCDAQGLLPRGSTVLVALSGGRDSMALLTALEEVAGARDLTLLAAHYHHGLRGAEADRDAAFVTSWCRDRGIPLTVGRGDVAGQAKRTGRGLEETARAMRYAFLQKTAADLGAGAIATAHNADDNLETLLLHLTRGAGLDGLAGIPPKRGNLIRPLLDTPRWDIDAYLKRKAVPWVEDSTNTHTEYARNRLRHQVLPVLRSVNPQVARTVAANLAFLREDRDYLAARAAAVTQLAEVRPGEVALPAAALAGADHPIAVRAVKDLLARLNRHQFAAAHLEAVLALAASPRPGGRLDLPGGLTARREYDRLVLSRLAPPGAWEAVAVNGPGTYPLASGWTVTLTACTSHGVQGPFRCALLPPAFPLTIRGRETGDRLTLPGRRSKTLKKWYIDEKIPRPLRDALPVLADRDGVLAAAGLGPQACRTAPPHAPALGVEFIPPRNGDETKRKDEPNL